MAARGPYAKGVAKREEILATALRVISERGYSGASVKELADAVGLTQAGLLHYFGSKDELFLAVLRKRDEVDSVRFLPRADDPAGGPAASDPDALTAAFVEVIRHNQDVPGVVELFTRLAVEAADPSHPAHGYFRDRGRQLRDQLAGAIADLQADGRISSSLEPEPLARMVQALADGLQLQWLLEPEVDMAGTVAAFFTLFAADVRS